MMYFLNLCFFAVLIVYSVLSDRSEGVVSEYISYADHYKDRSESSGNSFAGDIVDEELSKLEEDLDSKINKKGQISEPYIESYSNDQEYGKKSTSQESGADKSYTKGSKNIGHKKSYKKGNHNKYGTNNRYEESYGNLSNSEQSEHISNQNNVNAPSKITKDFTVSERVERSADLELESITQESKKQVIKKSQNIEKSGKSNMKIDKNGKQSKKRNTSNRQKRSFDYFGFWN